MHIIRISKFLLVFILLILFAGIHTVESKVFYKWIDKKGHIHITDYPPSEGEAIKIEEFEAEERSEQGLRDKIQELLDSQGMEPGHVELPPELEKLQDIDIEEFMKLSEGDLPFQFSGPVMQLFTTLGTALFILSFALSLLMNLFFALCMYLIARKVGVSYAWMSWVPFLNIFPLFGAAGYRWYVALMIVLVPIAAVIPTLFIPQITFFITVLIAIALFVFFINLWIRICENLETSKWLGLLIIIPFINLFLPPYLAFKNEPALEGFRRLRPTLITFIVFVILVGAYSITAPYLIMPHFNKTLTNPDIQVHKEPPAVIIMPSSNSNTSHLIEKDRKKGKDTDSKLEGN